MVQEMGLPIEKSIPVVSHLQNLPHTVVSSTPQLGMESNSSTLMVIGKGD